MAIKKALVALGLVCVVAPALASAAFMAREGVYSPGQGPDGRLAALIASLQELIDRENEGVELVEDGSEAGRSRIPFRPGPRGMIDLSNVIWKYSEGTEEAFSDGSTTSGIIPGPGGPIEASEDEAAVPGSAGGDGSMASNGGVNRAGGGIGGGSSAGRGAGAGGGPGSEATDLALLVEPDEEPLEIGGPEGEAVSVMPLPASVWMLLASMAGLVVIGYQRRKRPF